MSLDATHPMIPPSAIAPVERMRLVLRELWRSPADRVLVVLDAARDPRIHPAILRQPGAHACLYAEASRSMAAVAPYVVELSPETPFTRWLLTDAWGASWGFFVRTQLGLDATRRHFKRFLRARTEDGRTLLFRFYDPRVMRRYLPTCTDDELTALFGEADAFVMEAEQPDRLWSFGRSPVGFSCTLLALGPVGGRETDADAADLGATLVVS
ncbi:MAG: DUF4123 domain-containing protein [Deltaproteobacteria bacterium]|nr:DUF4123 domain-containing protein [Deltaproteobacteria bacterium]